MSDRQRLIEIVERILRSEGRLTASESADLDYAHDLLDEWLAAYVQAHTDAAHERERQLDARWQERWRNECDRADAAEQTLARVRETRRCPVTELRDEIAGIEALIEACKPWNPLREASGFLLDLVRETAADRDAAMARAEADEQALQRVRELLAVRQAWHAENGGVPAIAFEDVHRALDGAS